jgi:hypothetical protein
MAPSRGKVDKGIPNKKHSSPAFSVPLSSLPRTGIRRPLSPVREYRVVTDAGDSSEVSEIVAGASRQQKQQQGQEQSQPTFPARPVSAASSGETSSMPPPLPPADNELSSMETEDDEASGGSASSPVKSGERTSVPQHEMDGSSRTDEESKSAALVERNKMILLQGLSLTHIGGNLTLVSVAFVIFGLR